jgi:hypothetical protein
MKFTVTMKTPDVLHDSITESVIRYNNDSVISYDDHDDPQEEIAKVEDLCKKKWFKYGEYVTLEIDTETNTCVVKERS